MKGFIMFTLFFNMMAADAVIGRSTKEERKAVENTIETVSSELIQVLNDEDLSREAKLNRLETIIEPYFDFSLMAKFSIGRRWKKLTGRQKEQYVALFKQHIMRQYVARLLDIKMTGWHTRRIDVSKEGTKYIVRVDTIVNQKPEPDIEIQWVLGGANIKNLKCLDVSIEGISLLSNLQRELRALLRRERNNIANFLRHLANEVQKVR